MDVFSGVCLSVCLFVCQHDNFRTIKRRMVKLGGYLHCIKSRRSLNVKVKDKRSRSPGTKNEKVQRFFRERSLGAPSSASSTPVGISVSSLTSGYAMVVHGRPKTPKIQVLWVIQPPGVVQPYILGDTTRPGHVTCVLV